MTALDFPNSPIEGQVYNDFVWDSAKGVWKSLAALGGTLDDLTDVSITPPIANGAVIAYNTGTSSWDNRFGVYDSVKYNPTTGFSVNQTITSGYNGFTVGPTSIESGITVTVSNNSVWVIL